MPEYAQTIVNGLAVLGGFLAGYLLCGLLANLLDRSFFLGKSPRWLHRLVRILGGFALALLVAMIVFGHGKGWNFFGGGADGDGQGEPNGTQPISVPFTEKKEIPPSVPQEPERIKITILGGSDVKEQKFYVVNDETTAKNFTELKAAVLKSKEAAAKPPSLEIHFSPRNVLPSDHPAVSMLTRWARETAGLDFTMISR